MTRAVVLYTSLIGHTEKIAEHVTIGLLARGIPADMLNAGAMPEDFGPPYNAIVVVGSVASGRHSEQLTDAVKRHVAAIRAMYSAFCSVSLEAAVVAQANTPDQRAAAEIALHQAIGKFLEETGWTPELVEPVAGALPYAHVGPWRRILLERVAHETGLPTDTNQDHVFTDWEALDRFLDIFAERARVMP